MKTIGFVGTAKNTGKTTTALHMLDRVNEAGIGVALTSIGYDGENTDHVTGLPKPRYYAQPGAVIATAERCLKFGSAQYAELLPTGLQTIMGEIMIAAVAKAGYVVLAGPNRRVDIQRLLDLLAARGVELVMVDGALNRLAAMTAADGMVLSTGASFDENIPSLAAHAAAMESLFHYPQFSPPEGMNFPEVTLLGAGGKIQRLGTGSILDETTMQLAAGWFKKNQPGTCITPGVFNPQLFQKMLGQLDHQLTGCRFVFNSPLNLLAAGNPEIWQSCFADLAAHQCQVSYLIPTPLHFMTVNPFYPRYLQKTGNYIAAYVDKRELLEAGRRAVKNTLVVDILQPPLPDLLAQCKIKKE